MHCWGGIDIDVTGMEDWQLSPSKPATTDHKAPALTSAASLLDIDDEPTVTRKSQPPAAQCLLNQPDPAMPALQEKQHQREKQASLQEAKNKEAMQAKQKEVQRKSSAMESQHHSGYLAPGMAAPGMHGVTSNGRIARSVSYDNVRYTATIDEDREEALGSDSDEMDALEVPGPTKRPRSDPAYFCYSFFPSTVMR